MPQHPADRVAAPSPGWIRHLSPSRLLVIVVVMVFLGESADMFVLRYLPPVPWEWMAFIDASILLILLSPSYFILYLPLKTHYAERQKAEREVAFLSRHVLRAVEDEKKRLAHEMHDDCGQIMTALQFGIESLKCSLPAGHPELNRQCERLEMLTSRLAEHVRDITARLRPLLLENQGLEPALRWHLQDVGRDWPELDLSLQITGCAARLPPIIEITLFRLCQEALNNIVQHARAAKAGLFLDCDNGKIRLRIEDDGIGFDPQKPKSHHSSPKGFGILGMRERAADLGGDLSIRSAPGTGTVIEIELPLKERTHADSGCHCG